MILKIFKEEPLSFGIYSTLPGSLINEPGKVLEISEEEATRINNIRGIKKFENGRIEEDLERTILAQQEKEKMLNLRTKQDKLKKIIITLKKWFNDYDIANSQFIRKTFLYQNKKITKNEYEFEQEKINSLHLEAEEKSSYLKQLEQQLAQLKNEEV